MKSEDVAAIAGQFGLTPEIVEASVVDGTLGQRIKDSMSKKVVYEADQFEGFKRNYAAEVTNNYFSELVEKAKKGDLPQDLYVPVKGAAYQQLERDLAKKYEVDQYKDVQDLIERAVKKSSANPKTSAEIEKQIEELKAVNLRLEEEKRNAVKDVEQQYKAKHLDREKAALLNDIPFDFSDVKADELATKRAKTQTLLKSVFDAEYKMDMDDKGNVIVLGKDGKVLRNNATLDPIPVKDVMVTLAKEYNLKLKSPDTGGQGGQTSGRSNAAFSTPEEFYAYCTAQGINPHSVEGIKLWREAQK